MINPKLHRYLDRLDRRQDYIVRELVEDYGDRALARRDLLERVLHIAGSAASAAGVLLALGVKPAYADPLAEASLRPSLQGAPQSPFSVPEGDPNVVTSQVTYPSGGASIQAYMARPRAGGRSPAVLICHENAGIGEHFRDVARRYAKAGYVGLAVDLLSRVGGTDAVPTNERNAILFAPGSGEQWVADFRAGMAFLRQQPFVLGDRIGMTGYCFGGGVVYDVVAAEPTLRAAAPLYGFITANGDPLRNAKAATLVIFGANDQLTNNIPAIEAALQAARVPTKTNVYPNAGHAFFNDTRTSYVESAATAAWRDTLAWFATYLRGAGLPATGDGSTAEDGAATDETEEVVEEE